jgi:hypothetical protein
VPIHMGAPTGACDYSHAICGNTMGGVAAKAAGIHYHTRPLVRKNLRARHRTSTPKSLRIPAKVLEETESRSAPVCVPRPAVFLSPTPPVRPPFLPMPEPIQALALDFDTDTETEIGIPLDEIDMDERKTMETMPSFTDFSRFLDLSKMGDDFNNTSVTVVQPDACSPLQSTDDLYGWEAELNRKSECEITDSSVCTCDGIGCHQVRGSKPGLLYRVFSSGRRPS